MEYTTKQYAAELYKRLKEFQDAKAVFDCVAETHRSQINRIFIKGQGAERKLGTYSKAYAKLKEEKNREFRFVNFNLTDMLQNDFATSLKKRGQTYVSGVKNAFNAKKVDWLADRYGEQAFDLSKDERKDFVDCVRSVFLKIMRG